MGMGELKGLMDPWFFGFQKMSMAELSEEIRYKVPTAVNPV